MKTRWSYFIQWSTFLLVLICILPASAQIDTWTQKANVPGPLRSEAVGFSIGGKGYIGGGGEYPNLYSDFWEYDPLANSWTQKAAIPGPARRAAFSFVIGSKAYIGAGGTNYFGAATNDFWEYDPATDQWTQKADFPYSTIASGFSIGDKGYGFIQNQLWEYDPLTDAWTRKADFTGTARYTEIAFGLNGKGYIGLGTHTSLPVFFNDFFQYDPVANSWLQVASFPGDVSSGSKQMIFATTAKAYVLTYGNPSFWEYDAPGNSWSQKSSGIGFDRGSGVGFSIGTKGYVGTGFTNGSITNEFWEYTHSEAPPPPNPPAGNAIQLNGSTDYVEVNDDPALDLNVQLSIEAWIKLQGSTGTYQNVVRKDLNYILGHIDNAYNTFYVLVYNGGGWQYLASTKPPSWFENQWVHVAVTYESGSFNLYLNGELDATTSSVTGTLNTTSSPLHIGSVSYAASEYFNGYVDEVRIWNTFRTQTEIQSALDATLSGSEYGLVAYYKMDETGSGTGLTVANSATATGAVLNGTTQGTGSTPVFSESVPVDNSIKFDGSSQEAQLGTWFNYQEFTISMWVKPAASQVPYANIIDNNHTGFRAWVFQQDFFNTNQYGFGASGTSTPVAVSLSANTWQHVTLVSTASQKLAYVNGVLAGTQSSTGPITYDGTQTLQLANWGGGPRNWSGEMDEVRIYDRAFSASEVAASVYAAESPTAPNLQAYYKMNETGGSVIYDSSPNGRDGILVNSPTFQLSNLPAAPPVPTITSITPPSGGIGSAVTINGTNFSTTPANNIVNFNGTAATVSSSTSTSITTTVPLGATTGTVTVAVGVNTATSAGSFTILPPTVLTADSLALVAFYNTTSGPLWVNNAGWLTTSVANWTGITVAGNRVTHLNLSNNNLTGIIPNEIGSLNALTSLDISLNNLTGTIPVEIGNASNLTNLNLSFNNFTGTIPQQLGGLTSLTSLSLAANELTGTVPPELGNLTALTNLNISLNSLIGDVPPSLGNLANLNTIGLNNNSFTGIPTFVSPFVSLFNVQNNNLTFEDIEPNVSKLSSYAPQKSVASIGTLVVPIGQTLTIPTAVGGTSNSYQWVKDGVDISGATSATFSKPNITSADKGTYTLRITNSMAPALTLTMLPVFVNPDQNALNFVAANANQVIVPHSAILNPSTELTLEAWVNLPNVTNNQKIVGKTNFNGYLMGVANGGIYNEVWNSNNGTATSINAGTIPPNVWTHLAVTFKSGGNMISYINGLQVSSVAVGSGPIDANSNNLLIGNSYGYFATGTIDEVAVWNVARTSGEIQNDMLGTISPSSSLLAYYDFNQGIANGINTSVNTLLDRSNNGNNGTLSGFSLNGTVSNWVNGYTPPPIISAFNPLAGGAGSSVTITGTNFDTTPGNNIVKFNGTTAAVSASSATSITATVPAGATTGPITVTVNGQTGTSSSNFTVIQPPTLTSFTPLFGPIGTTVTISGTNFDTTPANNIVKFNGTDATVSASTATSLTVTVPPGATTGQITVTVNSQTATSAANYFVGIPAPVVTSFSPTTASVGTNVIISGNYFDPQPANNLVKFNGTTATVTASTVTSISTTVPLGVTSGAITVTVNGQTGTSSSDFTLASPIISSVSPPFGPVGTIVVITGNFFSPVAANNLVKFNGIDAVVTASTTTTITTSVPAGATEGPITVTISGASVSSPGNFLVGNPAPTIESFTPSSGAEGTEVTITGTFFSATATDNIVQFNNTTASVLSATETSITTTVPFNATTGRLSVTRDGLKATSTTDFIVRISDSDSLALVALYEATNGSNWKEQANWLTGNVDTWFGVTVTNAKIVKLSLPNNGLAGQVPSEVATLDELTEMDFSANELTSIPDLSSLPVLTALDLSQNKLDFVALEPVSGMSGLLYAPQDSVDLADNTLVSLGSEKIFQATLGGSNNSYQWFKNDEIISGATNSTYTLTNISFKDEGSYRFEATNSQLPDLTLYGRRKKLRVSSIERDSIALRQLYEQCGGNEWTNKTNWLTTPLATGNWFGITIAGNRVTEINLPNNNISGKVPPVFADIENLVKIDLSSNQLKALPDVSKLTNLSQLNVSNNQLDFESLIATTSISSVNYLNQAKIGSPTFTTVAFGTDVPVRVSVKGTGNLYQWFLNDAPVSGATDSVYTIPAINRFNMGNYRAEITNPTVPGLTLVSANKRVLATAIISGRLLETPSLPVTKGQVVLLKINPVGAWDTTRVQPVAPDGAFLLDKVLLDDYVLVAIADAQEFPNDLPTYVQDKIYWEEADRIELNENREGLEINMQRKPVEKPQGEGLLSGTFLGPDEPGGKTLANKRIANAGVSIRRKTNQGRPQEENLQLISYIFTNEQGEFSFENLEQGNYLLNLQYPGYPMDAESYANITIGSGLEKQVFVVAKIIDNKIVVRKLFITGWDESEDQFNVYPNPVTTQFTIDVLAPSYGLTYAIFNTMGQNLNTGPLGSFGPNAIQVGSLPPGVYQVAILQHQAILKTFRIVIN